MTPRNFGRDAQRRSRRVTREALPTIEDERWECPPHVIKTEYTERWVDDPACRITIRTVRDEATNRIVDYAFTHEITDDRGQWHQIARIDCSHQEVHRHWPPPDSDGALKREVIRPIYSQTDVEDTYHPCLNEIFDNIEVNEGKWRNGR
ncbi:DUF7718 family protein [Paramicrobacterium sp. CJ85]|uniref:DUF7718 family protein n=1 Tax=Paramicrobacterium sp. CJ85 TaxID=3445355 RepID=UPI003F61C225